MKQARVKGPQNNRRGFRRIIELLIWLVIVPTVVLLILGILMLVFWQAQLNVLFGILVVTLVACLVTGAVLLLILLYREAKLSKLQMDFVSKVSHELRTPLTSIRMFAETLKRRQDSEDAEAQLCLEALERETERLDTRIERLLDWGRMEAGRKIYERGPDTVRSILDEAIETVKPHTEGRDRQVEVVLAEDLPTIYVDRGAMVDVIVNLLTNALKYAPSSDVITVRARAGPRAVRIAVTDHGIGIPRREHRNIFQKFYRVDERLSSAVEGSGLGLAIVYHVVHGHGGRVEVESEPGRGSTFTIVLPRREAVERRAGATKRS